MKKRNVVKKDGFGKPWLRGVAIAIIDLFYFYLVIKQPIFWFCVPHHGAESAAPVSDDICKIPHMRRAFVFGLVYAVRNMSVSHHKIGPVSHILFFRLFGLHRDAPPRKTSMRYRLNYMYITFRSFTRALQ